MASRRGPEFALTMVKVNGHWLNVERIAGPSRRVFVCLHGLADNIAIWDRVAPGLAQLGGVVMVDQRAHGGSEAPPGPYTRQEMADDVAGVIDALRLPAAILVGHSAGGIVAMETALRHPDKIAGLVLIGTASQCNARAADFYERIAQAAETQGMEGAARVIFGDAKRSIIGDAAGFAHVARMLKSLHDDPLTNRLSSLRCPALIVVGEKDPMGPRASELIRDAIPGAEFHLIPGRGHWVHREAPARLLELIEEFVTTRVPEAV